MQSKVRLFADSILSRARSLASQKLDRHGALSDANARLARLLHSERNYRRTWRLALHPMLPPTQRPRRGAVPFLAAALGQVGVNVPRKLRIDGLPVNQVTLALSRYLDEQCGWMRVERVDELRPGDVIFTRDAVCCPGIPDHVFVFMGWSDRDRAVALASDDQGFTHARPLFPDSDPQLGHAALSGFGYALRQ